MWPSEETFINYEYDTILVNLTDLKRKCGSSSPSSRLVVQKLFNTQQLKLHCKILSIFNVLLIQ